MVTLLLLTTNTLCLDTNVPLLESVEFLCIVWKYSMQLADKYILYFGYLQWTLDRSLDIIQLNKVNIKLFTCFVIIYKIYIRSIFWYLISSSPKIEQIVEQFPDNLPDPPTSRQVLWLLVGSPLDQSHQVILKHLVYAISSKGIEVSSPNLTW